MATFLTGRLVFLLTMSVLSDNKQSATMKQCWCAFQQDPTQSQNATGAFAYKECFQTLLIMPSL